MATDTATKDEDGKSPRSSNTSSSAASSAVVGGSGVDGTPDSMLPSQGEYPPVAPRRGSRGTTVVQALWGSPLVRGPGTEEASSGGGSNVVLRLIENLSCRIVCIDKLDYCSSIKNLDTVINHPNFKFVQGNICSYSFMLYLLQSEKIDTVMHFAASTHVDNSFGNSFAFTENNIMGTHVLLEATRSYGQVKRFIHVSTDEVYGETSRTVTVGEGAVEGSTLLAPTNPYAATKAGAEFLAMSYYRSYKVPVIITRGNNVYGPRQYPEKLIPKFTLLFMRGEKLPIHGTGEEKRCHLYVDDVARAFQIILLNGSVGEVYNIGTSREISNIEVASKLAALFGHSSQCSSDHLTFVENRPFNDYRYQLNISKLAELGWRQEVDFDEGLRLTVDWYKSNCSNWTVHQIAQALVPHPRLQNSDTVSKSF
ncbi:dTDP-4-dehydrorhamnose reductase [Pelomyxa schiedti]|nr:dTDP-4-dehydrorhamnose reductase [Pelomyxa schiedti]